MFRSLWGSEILKITEWSEPMRHVLILATASLTMILAGCTSDSNSGYGTSGSSGVNERVMSPDTRGMGQGMSKESLNNSGRAGSGASGTAYENNETISPNERGMGEGMTRRSLPNTAGSSSSSR